MIVFGAEIGGAIDPMLVRFSDVENYGVFTATATNSAGSFRLTGGSEIMTALASSGEILIWTDTVLWAMRFSGLPYVYGFFQQGTACGAISPNAVQVLPSRAVWMGLREFFQYSGQVTTLPCDVWDDVFRNLNQQQRAKVHCGRNTAFNEVTWFYPSAASIENDRYVTWNYVDNLWTTGTLSRTAWLDAEVLSTPFGTAAGQLFAHESGTNADGQPLPAFIESGLLDMGSGQDMMTIGQMTPDFRNLAGSVQITLKGQAFPADTVKRTVLD